MKKILSLTLSLTLSSQVATMAFADNLAPPELNLTNLEYEEGFNESASQLSDLKDSSKLPEENLNIHTEPLEDNPIETNTNDNLDTPQIIPPTNTIEDTPEDTPEDTTPQENITDNLTNNITPPTITTEDGTPPIGWFIHESNWYYFHPDGTMATGWLNLNNTWYYLQEDGIMATGWINIDGRNFYLHPSGAMAIGWLRLDNKWYYLDIYGAMTTGWLRLNNTWYYLNENGEMALGWYKVGDSWYYSNIYGAMQTGWLRLNGLWYYLNEYGAMDTGWLRLNNTWYYLNDSGVMALGWYKVNGSWYYSNEYGAMQTGWLWRSNSWYYLNEYGAMVTDWMQLNNRWYYFYPVSGVMASNTTIDGYTLGSSGACTNRSTISANAKYINVPYISQKGVLPTGCEIVSATMLLRYYGNQTSIYDFVDKHLEIAEKQYINGIPYAPTPDEAFIGNPRKSNGYGCYPPVIERALKSILGGAYTPKVTTGTPIETLIKNYIDNDIPVLLWATINMLPSYSGDSWYTKSTGERFTWTAQEHCMVLVGYDNENYYFNDPYNSNGFIGYRKVLLEARFRELGMRSLVIE